ncbi:MAG TPA: site-specific integrase [Lachnospiraceae bacterium]|nr:site-specific integrase [Lachnospiraceae bacterium]
MTKHVNNSNMVTEKLSFSQAAEEWLAFLEPQLKESSIVKYRNILNLYLLPQYGDCPISEISRTDVAAFSSKLLTCGGMKKEGLAPKTVTGIIAVAKSIFGYAIQERACPVADVKGISVKQSQKTLRVLSRVEQQKLSSYLRKNLSLCNLGILTCLYTGLRIGEICALKWEDILFAEQYLYVYKTMQRLQTLSEKGAKTIISISAPKSECSVRKIPIPDELFQLFTAYRQPDKAYFLTGEPNQYMEPRTMENRFKLILKQCGINDAHFHTLRHTFATRCVELGFDVKSLSEILGHSTVNITMNRYVHPSMELKQKNMNMLSGLFLEKK